MFERGMRTERLNEIFSTVKPSLVPLIQAIAASPAKKSYKAPQPLEVCNRELIHTCSLIVFDDIIHIYFQLVVVIQAGCSRLVLYYYIIHISTFSSTMSTNFVVVTSLHILKGGPLWLIDSQKALCAEIAEKIGFDFNK